MLEEFIKILEIDLCASLNTIKAYSSDVTQFMKWIAKKRPQAPQAILRQDLYQYVETCLAPLKSTSINRKITAIVAWVRFLEKGNAINLDIPLIKKEKNIPKTISNSNFEEMKHALQFYKAPLRLKLAAILEMLYSTGMRVSEMIRIKFSEIKPALRGNTNGVIIVGKGNKERLVFLTPEAKQRLEEYCNFFKIKSGHLWPGASDKHITRQTVHYLISRLGAKVRVNVSPHSMRHRLAVNLVQNGMELVSVQKILGHAHINTTGIYTTIDDDTMHEMIERYHPLGYPACKKNKNIAD